MIRRIANIVALAAVVAIPVAACNSAPSGPALTDPKEIVTAALKSTEAATSVHLDIAVDGAASVALPQTGGTAVPIDLTGTTASADIDLEDRAAKATFSVPAMLGLGGEIVATDGMAYVRTTLTGALFQQYPSGAAPIDPSNVGGLVDGLGDLLFKDGVELAKGPDVACGTKQCYTVTASLTAEDLGSSASGGLAGLPVDVAGASLELTLRVEKDVPHHLAGVTAEFTLPNDESISVDVTASKWDEPVTISAPPAEQVKPVG